MLTALILAAAVVAQAPTPARPDDTPPAPPLPATVDLADPRHATAPADPRPAAPVYAGDPYGFTAWLNGVRARNGRGPVGHDPNLSAWAATNNGQQRARGMGHHVMTATRRQNAAAGPASAAWPNWMASSPHQAALLDPTLTWIGIAFDGYYWTFNGR